MFASVFDTVALLFVAAAVFGYINHKVFRLPFAIGIMAAGLLASLLLIGIEAIYPIGLVGPVREMLLDDINFSEALMHGMLSFLLFAGAMHTDLTKLQRWAAPIGILASLGVLISAGIIGLASFYLFGALGLDVPFLYCLVFGALITPTDPVAVLGIMKAAGAPEDIEIKVVGESLFNDGVGVVLFTVLVSIAVATGDQGGESLSAMHVVEIIGLEVVGGVVLGLVGGYIAYLAMRTLQEPNLETLISIALVMGLTVLAFAIHSSAPLACVVAGLFIGNHGREVAMDAPTRQSLDTVWHFIDEALNAILFLLIGLEVLNVGFETGYILAALGVIVLSLTARGIAVYVPMATLNLKMDFIPGTKRILWWGGIKGGISVALALSLPRFPGRDVVIAVTYATVIVSVLLQGLTIGKLIKRVVPEEFHKESGAGHRP
jgi:CPA1 family monovalent cation:H+ antiporter